MHPHPIFLRIANINPDGSARTDPKKQSVYVIFTIFSYIVRHWTNFFIK